jgi:hypothetical protein
MKKCPKHWIVAELVALLPVILRSSPGFDPTGDRAFKGGL